MVIIRNRTESTALIEKLSAAFEARKPLSLSIDDIDLIVAAGTLAALSRASFSDLETQAHKRVTERSIGSAIDRKSKSSVASRADPDMPFSVKSLAEHWGVADSTIRKILRSGELEHFYLGGTVDPYSGKGCGGFREPAGRLNLGTKGRASRLTQAPIASRRGCKWREVEPKARARKDDDR